MKIFGLNEHTPIEQYVLKGRKVDVKRDDLVGDGVVFPRWCKIGGIKALLEDNSIISKDKPLVHFSASQSWTGWVLSRLCKELGISFISAFGDTKVFPQFLKDKVIENGGELLPLKHHMPSILRNRLKTMAKDNDWQVLPYGFEHSLYISYMKERMYRVLKEKDYDHLVVSSGSGVTMVGLCQAFLEIDDMNELLMGSDKRVHTALTGSEKTVLRVLERNDVDTRCVGMYNTPFEFKDRMSDYSVPFDCNEFWDKKSWWWLEQNIENLQGEILFWNIGGDFSHSIRE